ncbi:Palmitoyltransferase ZDHHC9 [Sarcoptes scabiei]|uniref:Palmitoyltransferase n=1 Tax=Sarcoptes scabiei TaxID=52283 RepID=A0A834VCW3_SARSC|nr:Palmitoyltransferase ZDHHC9 [Sarcoptes scabiei]
MIIKNKYKDRNNVKHNNNNNHHHHHHRNLTNNQFKNKNKEKIKRDQSLRADNTLKRNCLASNLRIVSANVERKFDPKQMIPMQEKQHSKPIETGGCCYCCFSCYKCETPYKTSSWVRFKSMTDCYCYDRCKRVPRNPLLIQTSPSVSSSTLGQETVSKRSYLYLNWFIIFLIDLLFLIIFTENLLKHFHWIILFIGQFLFLLSLLYLLSASCTDPGISPFASDSEALDAQKELIRAWHFSVHPQKDLASKQLKVIKVNGQPYELKYCYSCRFFRTPRSSHCSYCDRCIERFDHHCPWIGNCVGKRNYRSFFMYLLALSFYFVYISSCALTSIVLSNLFV